MVRWSSKRSLSPQVSPPKPVSSSSLVTGTSHFICLDLITRIVFYSVKSTTHEAPHYITSCSARLPRSSKVQIPPSAFCYRTHFICLLPFVWETKPCHQGMARPRVADRGTASNMEGSCEYIE
jgi:hypothetical protein